MYIIIVPRNDKEINFIKIAHYGAISEKARIIS